MQAAKRAKNAVFCPWLPRPRTTDVDIQTCLSKGPNVFPENLAQIRSAVLGTFHTQTKKSQRVPKTEPYIVHCVQ